MKRRMTEIIEDILIKGRFIVFGEVEINVEHTGDGYCVEVLDVDTHDTTCLFNLYTDKNGVVGFIEHSFGAITLANYKSVRSLTDLITTEFFDIKDYL